jgi:RNA polymerase sporulation-specific sigma factor
LEARENEDKRTMLTIAFEPLIKKCIKIYVKNPGYFEDAMQEGYFTILKCIKNYDVDSTYPFPAYVKRAVIYSIRDFSKKIRENISLDAESEGDNERNLYDFLKSDADVEGEYILKHDVERLRMALMALSPKQMDIIRDFFFKNMSMRDICKNRRCHYMAVVGLKDRAIKKMKEEMNK